MKRVLAAGYFLVLFACFKTETLFILSSFSLSARHSSESSPAHHLFYNEAHHSYVLWVPIEFAQFSHSEGRDQKCPNFFLQLELSLLSTGHSVHIWKTKQWHLCDIFCNYNFSSSHLHCHRSIDLYIKSLTYRCVFLAHSMQLAFTIKRISVCLLRGREGKSFGAWISFFKQR